MRKILPKESKLKLSFTLHAKEKMQFYGISESKIKRILRHPDRVEEGIAPGTIAMMKKSLSKKHPYETWVMYLKENSNLKIISCWKYPGKSPKGREIPIPQDIKDEVTKILENFRGTGI